MIPFIKHLGFAILFVLGVTTLGYALVEPLTVIFNDPIASFAVATISFLLACISYKKETE
jgi:hypothetical protein